MITNGRRRTSLVLVQAGGDEAPTPATGCTGMAMNSPAMIATFICTQKASVGAVNTSFVAELGDRPGSQSIRSAERQREPRPTAAG